MGELTIARPGGGGQGLPVGLIALWSGAADAIPGGWVLCDGQNGTPDLRGRFVLGAGGEYAVGAAGGEAEHRLTVSEMPSHTHSLTALSLGSWDSVGEDTAGGRPHTLDKISVTTNSAGGGQAHNNMPPYYALCYIMKT